MAVAQVQSAASTTASAAFGASTPVGNLIVVIFAFQGTFTSITDDISQTYTQIGSEIVGTVEKARAYYTKNGTAGIRTVTISVTTPDTLWLEELSGQDPTTPVDGQLGSIHNATTADFTDSVTLASANDVLIAMGTADLGVTTITTVGFTTDSTLNSNILAHKTITASGSTSVTFHNDNFPGGTNLLTWLIGVQATAAAGGKVAPRLLALLGVGT